jgi:hypothetical protein
MSRAKTLFADPSFVKGMARCSDLSGYLDQYNLSRTETEADSRALYSDWATVGEALMLAAVAHRKPSREKQLQLF